MRAFLGTLATSAALLFGSAASAEPVTYTFEGVVLAGEADLIGQTVYGKFTYDVSLSTSTVTCCSIGIVAQSEQAQTAPGAPPYATAFVTLSGGSSFATGSGLLSNYGRSEVVKLAGEEGSPGDLNRFRLESGSQDSDAISLAIFLQISDFLGTSSAIFPDMNAGLANDQRVNWLAPGAQAYGSIFQQSGAFSELVAQFSLLRVTAVPELPPFAFLAAGLLAFAAVRQRRALRRKA